MRRRGTDRREFRLADAVGQIYAAGELSPVLHGLLEQNGRLLDVVAGSVSLVHAEHGRYSKVAERGAPCGAGQSFPLDEGVTGEAVARRRPVVLNDYRRVTSGHLAANHPAGRGPVVAVPIWWRGDVLGVNVAFAGSGRRFTAGEVDAFEVLSQSAAAAMVRSGARTMGEHAVATRPASPLTRREHEVLALLADGLTDREMAAELVVSPKTIEKHVGALLRKTRTSSRTAAVVRAISLGWFRIR